MGDRPHPRHEYRRLRKDEAVNGIGPKVVVEDVTVRFDGALALARLGLEIGRF